MQCRQLIWALGGERSALSPELQCLRRPRCSESGLQPRLCITQELVRNAQPHSGRRPAALESAFNQIPGWLKCTIMFEKRCTEKLSLQPLTRLQSDTASVPRISCTSLSDLELSLSMNYVTRGKNIVPPSLPHCFNLMYIFNAHISERILRTLIFCSKLSHGANSIKSF